MFDLEVTDRAFVLGPGMLDMHHLGYLFTKEGHTAQAIDLTTEKAMALHVFTGFVQDIPFSQSSKGDLHACWQNDSVFVVAHTVEADSMQHVFNNKGIRWSPRQRISVNMGAVAESPQVKHGFDGDIESAPGQAIEAVSNGE